MTALVQISIINFSSLNTSHECFCRKPINRRSANLNLQQSRFNLSYKWSFLKVGRGKDGILMKDEWLKGKKKKREVSMRFNNQGFGFNNNGGGGGGGDGSNARVIGNLVLAIGLTYLTLSGQLGWVLDAIASIWLFAVVAPIVGLGVFLWWAGRDIVQGTCPNCGNDFQVFKSTLNEETQSCPFCTQPFSVVDDKFVRDPVQFSNKSTMFGQAFKDTFNKGKDSTSAVVDVEAEIKDAD
ncbi:uncharacterized protein [Rutidosis leptorrhynchoides]|uniref:uncharacterized protein n=1 Tax=Rutidosis leptorrhynchoides TaxID=125765 RepID=UPI003A9919DE